MTKIITPDCTRCGDSFTYEHTRGPKRKYCSTCRLAVRREQMKAAQARYLEANPMIKSEASRRYRERNRNNPEYRRKRREEHFKASYGLSLGDVDALVDRQGGRCAACGGEPCGSGERLHVDHDHFTGEVRGMLCARCNTALGLLKDDPAVLLSLVAYLGGEG